ncbi:hypothetical protein [uncultured Desulfovibrio sp.]|uniref:hypothetical protein n=1 Tax=uncultured Desulfovibrio sp. TaxID=167968 RepID=UPI0003A8AFCF|nr:hypothetical protein [uncultured Desulfovibrio sp.]
MFRLLFENTLRQRNISLAGTIENGEHWSIKNCVTAGLGVFYLSRFRVDEELRHGLPYELPFAVHVHGSGRRNHRRCAGCKKLRRKA